MAPDAPDDDDVRVKDDPALLAELASWFERPSIPVIEEKEKAAVEAGPESLEEAEWRETRERRDQAAAAADPALLERLWARETAPPPYEPLPPVELTFDETIAPKWVRNELDRGVTGDPFAPERDFGVPRDIVALVSEDNAPQAILRDLFRPVNDYQKSFESPFDELPDLDPTAVIREALREHLTVTWPTPPMDLLDQHFAEVREILDRPWADVVEVAKAAQDAGRARVEEEIRIEMWGR